MYFNGTRKQSLGTRSPLRSPRAGSALTWKLGGPRPGPDVDPFSLLSVATKTWTITASPGSGEVTSRQRSQKQRPFYDYFMHVISCDFERISRVPGARALTHVIYIAAGRPGMQSAIAE